MPLLSTGLMYLYAKDNYNNLTNHVYNRPRIGMISVKMCYLVRTRGSNDKRQTTACLTSCST